MLNLLLLLTLLSGQFAVAEHNTSTVDGEHHHSIDCVTCFAKISAEGSVPSSTIEVSGIHKTPANATNRLFAITTASRTDSIRAPPCH